MKRLSIYCGLRAIGWLVHDHNTVYQYGIKRLHVPFDYYYEYLAGLPISAMVNRRLKRQARRNRWRRKNRREMLMRYLGVESVPSYSRVEVLNLRVKALNEPLTHEELCAVLLSLQRKRGYKSLRGVSDNENSDYLQSIAMHEENLKAYRTIAEYLLTLPSSQDIIFNRQSYEDEFCRIADAQQMDDVFRKKVFGLIYYQNPLKKGRVARCHYEPNRSVCHASNPLYQTFRIWRDVNNVHLWDKAQREIEIPRELRLSWVEKLMNGTKVTKAMVCRDLGLKPSSAYEWLSGKFIAPHPLSVFDDLGITTDKHALWQELYSARDEVRLRTFLSRKYDFTDYQIDELCDIDFGALGWSDFSTKAIKRLLPRLQHGETVKQAILDTYGKVDFANMELRNWMVEKHFTAYRSLIDAICKKHKIDRIFFEIDYHLKAGNKQRKSNAKEQRAKEKKQKEFPMLNDYQLLKLQLHEQSKGYSPYVPDYEIPIDELLSEEWNIDHIVPKSKIFESGFSNMVLCPQRLNKQKGNLYTGIEFAQKIGVQDWYCKIADTMSGQKRSYLYMTTEQIPTDEISKRQNSDYNTKCFASVGDGVNIPNKIVSRYLRQWELNAYEKDDCRQYLAKAFVLANFDTDSIVYFDHLQHTTVNPYGLLPTLPAIDLARPPIFLQRIKYLRKTADGYTPRHSLHKETIYGQRKEMVRKPNGKFVCRYYYKVRHKLAQLTAPMVGKIMDTHIRQLVEKRIEQTGSHEKMLDSLVDAPLMHNGKPIVSVSIRTNATTVFPLHSHDGQGHTAPRRHFTNLCDYVFPATNYGIRLSFDPVGKVSRDVVSLLQKVSDANENRPHEEQTLLQPNDLVQLDGTTYFLLGASTAPKLRNIYHLSAASGLALKSGDYRRLVKLEVNQLGEIINTLPLCPFQE